ncbi:small ribosomal subunit protein eS10-like [Halichondria panicea]|uniref:small ribosomal subunit protein eS10-like n=1 Tax=Halichondria panicea TaxID=6063 RepID=UPI00312BAEE5
MLIPKKNRKLIYENLFKEGVLVAKKDFNLPQHPEIDAVPNLQVIKAMQSLKSRGYVKEQFSWQHYYWYLTNEGIQYLREYLHLPNEIVPATLKRPTRTETARARPKGFGDGDRERREEREDREQYRRGADFSGDKKTTGVGAGEGFNPQFRGVGFGRGKPTDS